MIIKIPLLSCMLAIMLTLMACSPVAHEQRKAAVSNKHVEISKSSNDDRKYQYLRLANGMKVLLISDPSAEKSAASIDVSVGHMADPKQRQGLTHFLEHMLFLGTDKYPDVGGFKDFIKAHGGSSNASTSKQHSNYYFSINHQQLAPALDRFAQFFISPSLDKAFIDREKNAVHAEFKLKLKSERRRYNEVLKTLSNPEHPMSQFSVGNLKTLKEDTGQNLRAELIKHYKEHYAANRMALVVAGKEPLNELESLVTTLFNNVPENLSKAQRVDVDPYTKEQLAVRINIEALKDIKQLTLEFPVTKSRQHWQKKPLHYITSMINRQDEGSLYQLLEGKGWLKSLRASWYGPNSHDTLTVKYKLTAQGLHNVDIITELSLKYFEFIKSEGVYIGYFEELQRVAQAKFLYLEKQRLSWEVSDLSNDLHYYPAEDLLAHKYQYTDFDLKLVVMYLEQLTAQNMRQIVQAQSVATDKLEPRYSTNYSLKPLPESLLSIKSLLPEQSQFKLPKPNPYIPKSMALTAIDTQQIVPKKIYDTTGVKLWFKQDDEFLLPRTVITVKLHSDKVNNELISQVKNELYLEHIRDNLNTDSYLAKQAGLNFKINSSEDGLLYQLHGYSEKQAQFIELVQSKLPNMSVSKKDFAHFKQKLLTSWQNNAFDRPISQSLASINHAVYKHQFSTKERTNALQQLSYAEFIHFISHYHQSTAITALVHGNLTKAQATKVANLLATTATSTTKLPTRHLPLSAPIKSLAQQLEIDHQDSSFAILFQGQQAAINNNTKATAMEQAYYRLISYLIAPRFFQQLRTEQQTGYVVKARYRQYQKLPGISFYIQSPKYQPAELQQKINTFLIDYNKALLGMSKDEFSQAKLALIKLIRQPDINLKNKTERWWRDIDRGYFKIDSREQVVQALQVITLTGLRTFFNEQIIKNSRKFISYNIGKHVNSEQEQALPIKVDILCRDHACSSDNMEDFSVNDKI